MVQQPRPIQRVVSNLSQQQMMQQNRMYPNTNTYSQSQQMNNMQRQTMNRQPAMQTNQQ
jgi:hypothetical protein